ncbi:MAG: hypothetical protein IT432_10400 [Phycisphaerales bacterium]|nr:hypothetical protein [Phycisphaerales bacterium]
MAGTIEMVRVLAQASSGLSGVLKFFGLSPMMLLIIVVGLVVAIGAWWLVKFVYKHREKAKELTLVRRMFASASGGPAAGADPAKRAAIDNMRRSFEEGVEKFRAAGKNVYTLPWILLAGPSGSGKTEAIRHCNVGFPPGLQNYLQGAGGTLNMHWWFTNDAVILDTAGRIFMENAAQGGGDEWRELLKMLKQVRPLCPVNGLLLCIGVDSLIQDSGDAIQEKAGKIAQQLDTIQRELDVRFPVYVVVTKCDLITGFREYFDKLTDPTLQHQMLGWSNPAPLDTAFRPEQVSEHLDSVRQRLLRRRYALTIDPVNSDDPQARRADQVDALFALPDSIAKLSSRLRHYLELIFVQGEWSPKPLFLRGIYFTSSMRQGAALDEEVASMLNIPVGQLKGGASAERSYFLRDVFKEKVFRESGLVTRASNVNAQLSRQRLLAVGSAIAAAVVLLGLTLFSSYSFRQEVGQKEESWNTLWGGMADLSPVGLGGASPVYREAKDIKFGLDEVNRAGAVARSRELAENPPSVPILLRPMDMVGMISKGTLSGQLKEASAALVERSVLAPMIEQSRKTMVVDGNGARPWDEASTRTLAGLIRVERGTTGSSLTDDLTALAKGASTPGVMPEPLDVSALAQYVLPAAEFDKAKPDVENLQSLVSWTYDRGAGKWPPAALGKDAKPIMAGAKSFIEYWKSPEKRSEKLRLVGELVESLAAFEKAEKDLSDKVAGWKANPPKSLKGARGYDAFVAEWKDVYTALASAQARVNTAVDASKFDPATLEASLKEAETQLRLQAEGAYALVLGAPRAGGATTGTSTTTGVSAVDQAETKAKEASTKAQALLAMANSPWPDDIRTVKTDLEKARDELLTRGLSERLASIRAYLGEGGGGARLLAKVGEARAYQARARAYELADASLKVETPKPSWGELSTAGAGVDAKLSDLKNQINQATSSLSQGSAKENAEFVLQMGARGARTAMVAAALTGASSDVSWVNDRVKTLSAARPANTEGIIPSSKLGVTLTLPMTMLDQKKLSPEQRVDPNAAAMIFADLVQVNGAVGDKDPTAFDDETIRRQAGEARGAIARYAGAYFTAWTSDMLRQAEPQQPESWGDAKREIGRLASNTGDACDSLRVIAEVMKAAISAPGLKESGGVKPEDLQAWIDALNADITKIEGSAYRDDRRQDMGERFGKLPDQAADAKTRIGDLPGAGFRQRYLREMPDRPEGGKGPGQRYWDLARVRFVQALSDQFGKESGNLLRNKAAFRKTPLVMERGAEAGGALSVEEIKQFFNALPSVAEVQKSAGGPEAALAAGGQTVVVPADSALATMFGGSGFENQPQLLAALRAWSPWVAGTSAAGEVKVTISSLTDLGFNESASQLEKTEGVLNAAGVFNKVSMKFGEQSGVATNTDGQKVLVGDAPIPAGKGLTIQFFKATGDAEAAATRTLVTPWHVLELIAEPDASPTEGGKPKAPDAESAEWRVPVQFSEGGKKYYMWLGLKFSGPVPSRKVWPTGDKWK